MRESDVDEATHERCVDSCHTAIRVTRCLGHRRVFTHRSRLLALGLARDVDGTIDASRVDASEARARRVNGRRAVWTPLGANALGANARERAERGEQKQNIYYTRSRRLRKPSLRKEWDIFKVPWTSRRRDECVSQRWIRSDGRFGG